MIENAFNQIGINSDSLDAARTQSRAFRLGERMILLSTGVQLLTPIFLATVVFGISAVNVFAQSSTGGPVFTADNGQAGKAIVNVIRIIYVLLFVGGFVGIAWACFNVMTGKEWLRPGIGSICCWGAGLIAMAVYKLSKGEQVDVNVNDLGGQ